MKAGMFLVRISATVYLLHRVHLEAGPWTMALCALMACAVECHSATLGYHGSTLKGHSEALALGKLFGGGKQ